MPQQHIKMVILVYKSEKDIKEVLLEENQPIFESQLNHRSGNHSSAGVCLKEADSSSSALTFERSWVLSMAGKLPVDLVLTFR